ncbi:MAG: universal stress protein [Bacteroides sp.]|nr:universal stress protein [Bacteroides sp.]
MSTLVTIAKDEQSHTAYFLKEELENETIDCFFEISCDDRGDWEIIRVQVDKENVERAIQIMFHLKEKYGMDIEKIKPRKRPRKILVPTDFSKGSEYSCQYAIHLAQKMNAEIKILHVYEYPFSEMGRTESATYMEFMRTTMKESETNAKQGVIDFTLKMKAYMSSEKIEGVKIHSSTAIGNLVGSIKGISHTYKPDLIVLGTIGRSENSKIMLAGLANAIINGLEIPLYAIPGPCYPEDFDNLKVLYATDFNEKDNKYLEHLLEILKPFKKQISCVHIDTEHNPAKKERMFELNLQLNEAYDEQDLNCRLIEDEDVFHGLKVFVVNNKVNLLSFTVHKRRLFKKLFRSNLFKKILQESSLPILIFPASA